MEKISLAERKKLQKIDEIMHTALHYFEENGYDNTRIDQLCDAAMISQSTFYNYFGNKEKIVELIMIDGLKDYREYTDEILESSEDPFDAVRKILMMICDSSAKYCNTVSVFHRIALQNEALKRLEEEHNALGAGLIEYAFEKTGRDCPFSTETLKVILGGCYTNPFLTLDPKEAGEKARETVVEFLDHLSR
jgi:AcrR family transcriptional regulator